MITCAPRIQTLSPPKETTGAAAPLRWSGSQVRIIGTIGKIEHCRIVKLDSVASPSDGAKRRRDNRDRRDHDWEQARCESACDTDNASDCGADRNDDRLPTQPIKG